MKKKTARQSGSAGVIRKGTGPGSGSRGTRARRTNINPILVIAGLCCLLYGNTLLNGYALDDRAVITENSLTKLGFGGIGELATHDHFYGYNHAVTGLYRPVPLITHAIEYGIAGQAPALSHLVNLLLYFLACLGVYYALKEMLRDHHSLLPLLAAVLFAVHPVHTEVVANIKGRDELLNLCFLSLSVIFSFRFLRRNRVLDIALCLLFFLLALLSKESAMTFVAVIPLALWFFGKARPVRILLVFGGLAVIAGLYLLIRSQFVDASAEYRILDAYHQHCDSRSLRLATSAGALAGYLRLYLFPHPLVYDYSYNQIPVTGWLSMKTLVSVAIHLILLAYALIMLPRRNLLSFCILAYFITLSVFANILTPTSAIFAERFLFIPSIACSLALAWLLVTFFKVPPGVPFALNAMSARRRNGFLALVAILVMAAWIMTAARNRAWKDDLTLFTTDLPHLGNNARAHYNLASWYAAGALSGPSTADTALSGSAIRYFGQTVKIDPGFSEAWFLMGVLLHNRNDYRAAIGAFDKAAQTATAQTPPQYSPQMSRLNAAKSWFRLGMASYGSSDFSSSLDCFRHSSSLDPRNSDAWLNMASCHYHLGQYDSSEVYFRKVTNINPREAAAWEGLGLLAWKRQLYSEAAGYFRKAVESDPRLKDKYSKYTQTGTSLK